MCPVGDRPLVDHAVDRVARHVPGNGSIAVNVHHRRDLLEAHLAPLGVHVSVEEPEALGTAGALGQLREWLDGRDVLVTNADAWLPADLDALVGGWDRTRVRLLGVEDRDHGDFGDLRYCGASLHPWSAVAEFAAVPSGLYEMCWAERWAAGTLDLVRHDGPFVDCGTAADYLRANLLASGGGPVIGAGASIGRGAVLERTVVWPGAEVAPGEVLVDAIRADEMTVLVR
jgi:N-acetyl-alpha-D-muramate 1-phosphate uridylyltransferase